MVDLFKELRSHKDGPCLSLVVPTFRSKPDSLQNQIVLKNAIKQAKETLEGSKFSADADVLIKKLDDLQDQINFQETLDGLGLYVSLHLARIAHFPFPVRQKVVIGNDFETRDIVYAINHRIKYYVLALSGSISRLYQGEGESLTEIRDKNFPLEFEEQHQHQPTSKPYNLDKSAIVQEREKQYFRKIDELLDAYLKEERLPVLLVGVEKFLGYYREVAKNADAITNTINGNFENKPLKMLSSLAWEEIQKYKAWERDKLIARLDEAVGHDLCVWGIEEVWENASNGKGSTLVVEKDYMMPGYIQDELFYINLDGREEVLQKKIADAVDNVIEIVLSQNGKVVFVEDGKLEKFDRIALLLRY